MKKQNLNEEVSRIKGMMGLNEGQKHSYTEGFGDDRGKESEANDDIEVEWEDPSNEELSDAHKQGFKEIEVYGTHTVEWEGTTHYVGVAPIVYDGAQLYADLDNVSDIEIDTNWEPSDDQIMNQGNYEGGISHGSGDSWQGR